ncbi:D-glycero-alpha-D-manno-heptose 1-phosphate guanylyltransferase [Acidithrix ferrooxidans]|uniref:D-glycero-alpha-D-manno-heptose 1-phosphate guanylyltransferase n=1 Tax=Acidithrix ferrooxidans TaxID=1280514 RepID=A0A0D8HKA8_9ACTN|nr:D-glycero-alpha-D-manno-heptose 1-phosphate guanylyltransferase [Acidithrix ferrooxidans]CAG4921005.1 unnamed protein product [Acidithrix sp. C25]
MQAVVLVGGMGTRLRPLTHEIPKQMLKVAGITMLERVVTRLGQIGVDRVVLSLGYKPDVFIKAFPSGKVGGVPICYAVEETPLDTAGAIKFAAEYAGIDSTFLVVNGDVLCDFDLETLVSAHLNNRGLATIALVPVEDPSAFGVVPTDSAGRVLAFIEKPARELAPSNFINAGIYVLEPQALSSVESGERVSIERMVFPQLVSDGHLFAEPFEGYWVDAGTVSNFYSTSMHFRRILVGASGGSISSKESLLVGKLPKGYTVSEDSLIARNARIAESAVILRSIIGDGVVIEAGAVIEDSIVMDRAIVASYSRITDSIIGDEVEVPPETIVEELSVLALGCDIGAGERLSGQKIPS